MALELVGRSEQLLQGVATELPPARGLDAGMAVQEIGQALDPELEPGFRIASRRSYPFPHHREIIIRTYVRIVKHAN
jgi:hypothetical protein